MGGSDVLEGGGLLAGPPRENSGIILEEWLAGFGERSKMQLEARVLDKRIVAALHNYSTVPVLQCPSLPLKTTRWNAFHSFFCMYSGCFLSNTPSSSL